MHNDQIDQLKHSYLQMDKDKNGYISAQELK